MYIESEDVFHIDGRGKFDQSDEVLETRKEKHRKEKMKALLMAVFRQGRESWQAWVGMYVSQR